MRYRSMNAVLCALLAAAARFFPWKCGGGGSSHGSVEAAGLGAEQRLQCPRNPARGPGFRVCRACALRGPTAPYAKAFLYRNCRALNRACSTFPRMRQTLTDAIFKRINGCEATPCQKHITSPRCTLAPNQLMRLRSRQRFASMRFHRCKNQGVWVSGREGKRTAKLSVNFSTAVLPALNPEALGRKLDVQSHGDACLVRRRRRARVRTNFCERPPFLKCSGTS